jgi:hypothetical protein
MGRPAMVTTHAAGKKHLVSLWKAVGLVAWNNHGIYIAEGCFLNALIWFWTMKMDNVNGLYIWYSPVDLPVPRGWQPQILWLPQFWLNVVEI